MIDPTRCLAVLVLECAEPGAPPCAIADRAQAERIAHVIAADLQKLAPDVVALDLVVAGALYDQAQVLRPGFSLHAALGATRVRLAAHAGGAILALGAHDGRMPESILQPDSTLFGSPLLVLPWLLQGETGAVADIAARFECDLFEHGLAGAGLVLAVQDAFGVSLAHARHMTLFDLCALTSTHYDHAGLGALWRIVETALLAPNRECAVQLPDGSALSYREGAVHANGGAPLLAPCRTVLAAHGIPLAL